MRGLPMNFTHLRHAIACAILTVVLTACGGGGGGGGGIGGGSGNSPPRFTSPTSFTFAENERVFFTLTATDPDGDSLTLRDDASGDGHLFMVVVDQAGGHVSRIPPKVGFDFENPEDLNRDNVYEQNITLSDGKSTVQTTIRITITDVNEAPYFITDTPAFGGIAEVNFSENYAGPVYSAVAVDPEGRPLTYRILSVAGGFGDYPVSVFEEAFSIDAATGVVSVNRPFDFEVPNPQQAVDITLEASDGTYTTTMRLLATLEDTPSVAVDGLKIGSVNSLPVFANFASSVGDIDGDGIDEIWISSLPYAELSAGAGGTLIFGASLRSRMDQGDANLNLGSFAASERLSTEYPSFGGPRGTGGFPAPVPIGDVDGNGRADLLVTARDQPVVTDIDAYNVGLLAIFIPDSIIADSYGSLTLSNTIYKGGIKFFGETNDDTRDLSVVAGDFDGDGIPDLAFGFPHRRVVKIVFGSSLRNPPYSRSFMLHDPAASEILTLRNNAVGGDANRGFGGHLAVMPDLDGDGADELVVSGEYFPNVGAASPDVVSADFQGRVYVLSGKTMRLANLGGLSEINLDAAENDAGVVYFSTTAGDVADIEAGGDIDHDGGGDIIVAHRGKAGNQKAATVIFGATVAALMPTGADVSMDFSDGDFGVTLQLSGQSFSSDPAGEITVGFLPNLTGGPGDELMIAFPTDSLDGILESGSILIVQDRAIVEAGGPVLSFSGVTPPITMARKLYGLERFGSYLITSDLDGDNIADLSMGSEVSYPFGRSGWGFLPGGGFYVLPGRRIQEIFAGIDATYDLNESFRVEVPPN